MYVCMHACMECKVVNDSIIIIIIITPDRQLTNMQRKVHVCVCMGVRVRVRVHMCVCAGRQIRLCVAGEFGYGGCFAFELKVGRMDVCVCVCVCVSVSE